MARGIPCYCLNAVKAISWLEIWSRLRATYVWEPGPREAGSWYDWTLRVGNRTANLSLAIGLRGCGGAIATMVNRARSFPQSIQAFTGSGQSKVILKNLRHSSFVENILRLC